MCLGAKRRPVAAAFHASRPTDTQVLLCDECFKHLLRDWLCSRGGAVGRTRESLFTGSCRLWTSGVVSAAVEFSGRQRLGSDLCSPVAGAPLAPVLSFRKSCHIRGLWPFSFTERGPLLTLHFCR